MTQRTVRAVLAVAGAVAIPVGTAAGANTLIVQAGNASAYPTITAAIQAADSGDTIEVYAYGVNTSQGNPNIPYVETIDLGTKELTIVGVPTSGQSYRIWLQPDLDVAAPGIVTIDGGQTAATVFENFKLETVGDLVPYRGMYVGPGSSPVVRDVLFTGLDAVSGAGVLIEWKGNDPAPAPTAPLFTDCVFNDCDALESLETPAAGMGGAVSVVGASPTFTETFIQNCSSGLGGGGVYVESYVPALPDDPEPANPAEVTLIDVSFLSNHAAAGGGLYVTGDSAVRARGTQWGSAGMRFANNTAEVGGGAIYTEHDETGTLEIVRAAFDGNSAGEFGGGIASLAAGPVHLVAIDMQDNTAANDLGIETNGGAVFHATLPGEAGAGASTCTITDSRLVGSGADLGAAIYAGNSDAQMLVRCTTVANSTAGEGHTAVFNGFGLMTVSNSIVYWNEPAGSPWVENAPSATGSPVAYFSDLQGGNDNPGDLGVVDFPPGFVDKDTDDVRLAGDSGCKDQGRNSDIPADDLDLDWDLDTGEALPEDLIGGDRVFSPDAPQTVDMGCYEVQVIGPCSPVDVAEPFGVLDLRDVVEWVYMFRFQQPGGDLNGDGIYDLGDVGMFIDLFLAGCP